MESRRIFLKQALITAAAAGISPLAANVAAVSRADATITKVATNDLKMTRTNFQFPEKFGLGGVGLGNAWHINTNEQIAGTLNAAWDAGIRYYDTSPFYGYGLSERRLGHFLFEKNRSDFLISTKIGRIFEADPSFKPDPDDLWKGQLNFKYRFDYSAEGVRRSVEDSLQRLGLSSIDMILVHDLSPDTSDLGEKWVDQFEIAKKGAFPELTKMREEGIIKGWGLGVNTPEPILKALEVSDPDIMLVAIQYTLFDHKNALNHVFPEMEKKKVKAIIGGPLNAGFAANRDRWNYGKGIPDEMLAKREKINAIIRPYNVSLSTVALHFAANHPVVGSVIPGASKPEQVKENIQSFKQPIPADLWNELKEAKLIEENAPVG